MEKAKQTILVLGGAGFIGQHAVKALLQRGFPVVVLSRETPSPDSLPEGATCIKADFTRMNDAEARSLFAGIHAVVFCGGADDRTLPARPAWDFFYRENVLNAARFFRLAREAGVQRGVLLGSYFTWFERQHPEWKLTEFHPYIRSRVMQMQQVREVCGDALQVMILELPYILGSIPGKPPLWKPLVQYLASPFPLFYTPGGTNVVSVQSVAQAIAGAIEFGKGGSAYVIGGENLSWKEFLGRLGDPIGKRKSLITVPKPILKFFMRFVQLGFWLAGKESGLHPVHFMNVQCRETYFDPEPAKAALQIGDSDLGQAFRETVMASGFEPRRQN